MCVSVSVCAATRSGASGPQEEEVDAEAVKKESKMTLMDYLSTGDLPEALAGMKLLTSAPQCAPQVSHSVSQSGLESRGRH